MLNTFGKCNGSRWASQLKPNWAFFLPRGAACFYPLRGNFVCQRKPRPVSRLDGITLMLWIWGMGWFLHWDPYTILWPCRKGQSKDLHMVIWWRIYVLIWMHTLLHILVLFSIYFCIILHQHCDMLTARGCGRASWWTPTQLGVAGVAAACSQALALYYH